MVAKRYISRLMHCLSLRESWVIFFILGIIMMNFPFLSIFNKSVRILGIPLLYLYLYAGWLISIIVILLFTKVSGKNQHIVNGHSPANREDRH